MQQTIRQRLPLIAWLLGGLVTSLAIIAWGNGLNWDLRHLDPYGLFPLFGLLAFSLMWTHYVILALRVYADAPSVSAYAKLTQYVVLFCLLAHPGLLVVSLYQDGFGLPPGSYAAYVGDRLAGFVILGTTAWLAFMAYEFKRTLQARSWWRYVLGANAVAMLAVLVHSLVLGGQLQAGWFQVVWYGYGVVLILTYAYLLRAGRLITSSS